MESLMEFSEGTPINVPQHNKHLVQGQFHYEKSMKRPGIELVTLSILNNHKFPAQGFPGLKHCSFVDEAYLQRNRKKSELLSIWLVGHDEIKKNCFIYRRFFFVGFIGLNSICHHLFIIPLHDKRLVGFGLCWPGLSTISQQLTALLSKRRRTKSDTPVVLLLKKAQIKSRNVGHWDSIWSQHQWCSYLTDSLT